MTKRTVIYTLEAGTVSGGVRCIYEHLNRLHTRGWHVEVYSLDGNRPAWFPLDPSIPWTKFGNYDHLTHHLSKRDAAKVGTWWRTAQPVAEASGPGEGFYFVQDVESNYYTAPKQQDIVMQTYDLPLVQLTDSIGAEAELPNCEFIGLGIDLNLYRPIDKIRRQVNAILSLSRPNLLKGWSVQCEVYRKLYHTKEFTLYSFGTSNVHPPYSSQIPRGIPDEELVRLYNRIGLFVSTSLHEGFSLTCLEAMACGAVVVTSDAGGNMVYSRNGENCLVVPPGDAQAIVDACLYLLENTEGMMALQEEGFKTAAEWPWDPVIDRLEEIYG